MTTTFKPFLFNIQSAGSKAIITTLLVVSNLCVFKVGFHPLGAEDFDITHNALFPLSHANWLHLLCNIWCMWVIRSPYFLWSSILISFFCSLLPEPFLHEPIMGMSGILFAMIGAKHGQVGQAKELFHKTWLFFVITALMPNVACLFHLYCISLGYFWGMNKKDICLWLTTKIR